MIKNKYVAFVLFVIVFMAFWNLADYLYTTFITNGAYHFTAGADGALPLALAIVSGYLLEKRNSRGQSKKSHIEREKHRPAVEAYRFSLRADSLDTYSLMSSPITVSGSPLLASSLRGLR